MLERTLVFIDATCKAGHCQWRKRSPGRRAQFNESLDAKVARLHDNGFGTQPVAPNVLERHFKG